MLIVTVKTVTIDRLSLDAIRVQTLFSLSGQGARVGIGVEMLAPSNVRRSLFLEK